MVVNAARVGLFSCISTVCEHPCNKEGVNFLKSYVLPKYAQSVSEQAM